MGRIEVYDVKGRRLPFNIVAAFSPLLLYFLAVAYWHAIGALPPMYWGEKE